MGPLGSQDPLYQASLEEAMEAVRTHQRQTEPQHWLPPLPALAL